MKPALILEKDVASRAKTAQILKSLGYVSAPVQTPGEALSVARAINFHLIVTFTDTIPNDRRSLTGELKRASPEAAVVLLIDNEDQNKNEETHCCHGLKRVNRSSSVEVLRRIVKDGVEDCGLPASNIPASEERRKS